MMLRMLRYDLEGFRQHVKRRAIVLDLPYLITCVNQHTALSKTIEQYRVIRNQCAQQRLPDPHKHDRLRCEQTAKQLGLVIKEQLDSLPNVLADHVPDGTDEQANQEIARWGDTTTGAVDHWSLAERWQWCHKGAVDLSGARFVVLRGMGAQLYHALSYWMVQHHLSKGYELYHVPYMVNDATLYGTGNLPKLKDDLFSVQHTTGQSFYLIPTAEVPLVGVHANTTWHLSQLPLRQVAYTPCFRKEAGSYGKDTHGLIRQHQFSKVELVWIGMPDASHAACDVLTDHSACLLKALGLAFRSVLKCSGDTGFHAHYTVDHEVWLPSQGMFREIASCSHVLDFQAHRLNMRYRDGSQKGYVHTLNASALPIERTWAALLEQHQRPHGLFIPEPLRPYLPIALDADGCWSP
jgi:seryl-tRNA synthetase